MVWGVEGAVLHHSMAVLRLSRFQYSLTQPIFLLSLLHFNWTIFSFLSILLPFLLHILSVSVSLKIYSFLFLYYFHILKKSIKLEFSSHPSLNSSVSLSLSGRRRQPSSLWLLLFTVMHPALSRLIII
ncbi:hypothetical protein PanWU01x14_337700 [Parasponia andersonii]|uniref:Uncharacterized protein n=1 Tax=Parasponia andersonii TaxID=3476 RepID=A0A2P5AFJ2_PARAD|nr:hypothetical protein PanWU01x14_337700 [Parasponia andersonii]